MKLRIVRIFKIVCGIEPATVFPPLKLTHTSYKPAKFSSRGFDRGNRTVLVCCKEENDSTLRFVAFVSFSQCSTDISLDFGVKAAAVSGLQPMSLMT